MLTPRRLLLMVVGFSVLLTGYIGYAHFLGHYGDFQPLPADFRQSLTNDSTMPIVPARQNQLIVRLEEAFGQNCEETRRRIKLQWPMHGVVMAADEYRIADGKLALTRVSVAHFGKPDAQARGVQINSVRGDRALIEFDKPLADLRDATRFKPVAGRLDGNVRLHNNRGTPKADDDIRVFTPWLAYRDDQHRIWTDAEVVLKDHDPEQRMVKATGLEVVLVPGNPSTTPGKKKAQGPSFNGVKFVRLERDVQMTMQIEGASTFLGTRTPQTEPPKTPLPIAFAGARAAIRGPSPPSSARKPPSQSPVVVSCQGQFNYYEDPDHDRAEFHDRVTVIRTQEADGTSGKSGVPRYDQLDCDRLVLVFDRKKGNGGKPRAAGDPAGEPELVSATATGKAVELVSDAEQLHATGTEMIFEKATSMTTLRGDPVIAEQAGHVLRLRGVLTLQATPDGKEVREARARGPGEIRLRRDAQPEVFARWRDELVSTKDGSLDRLTLSGQASFEDPLRGRLQADQLSVWIDAAANRAPVAKREDPKKADKVAKETSISAVAQDRLPRRLEATGNVSLVSSELVIPRTERLRLTFEEGKPAPPTAMKPGEPSPSKPTVAPTARPPAEPVAGKPQYLPAPEASRRQPIELSARLVDAKIVHDGARAELKELRTEGQVQVLQRAVSTLDKALDIKGERLHLQGSLDGYVVRVIGQPGEPAFVQLDKLSVMGPTVDIDQLKNEVSVEGVGSMKLPSKNDFQGNALLEPADVTIFWNQRMFFDGRLAEFDDGREGGVVAVQGPARLACRKLEVILDHPVALKGRDKKQPEPGLYRLFCDQDVRLERGVRYEEMGPPRPGQSALPVALDKHGKPRWREYQRFESREMAFEKSPEVDLRAIGPGQVVLLAPSGTRGILGQPPAVPGAAPAKVVVQKPPQAPEELKLTRIDYVGQMQASQPVKDTTIVKFFDNVELVHFAATDPDATVNLDRLPVGAIHLQCARLDVLNRKSVAGPSTSLFEARDRVRVHSREFHAFADRVTYDESKDLLILEGTGTSSAEIHRQARPGGRREPISAKKIWVWVRENKVDFDGVDNIRLNP